MGILWAISAMWEITEVQFAHLLPNFVECWWDALILDVIICNGIGIWVGLRICKLMEMREFKWVSIFLSTECKFNAKILHLIRFQRYIFLFNNWFWIYFVFKLAIIFFFI